mmetsp:Transcript_31219/g.65298  ORF Transcript_31219/g.65298 Transcript_31219/m.65298 type:complete len:387 (-) Transcript_31219:333-1493(-)
MRREVDPDPPYCPQAALVDEETSRRTERRLARYRAKFEADKKLKQQQIIMAQRQQQQKMWMMGVGTLAAMALGWIYYKKYIRKDKRRQRLRGDGLPRDLVLNEETEEELQQVFDEAAKFARAFPDGLLDQRDQLMMYGLYKQAKEGDRNGDAPSKLNVVACAKYDSWGKFKGLPKPIAMKKYCEVVYHFSTGGESIYKGDDNADVNYDDDEQDNLDEDGCPINENGDDFGGGITAGMGAPRLSMMAGTPEKEQQIGNDSTPEVRLRKAAMSNDAELLEEVMEGECKMNDGDESGQTALHFAADRGSIDCLKLLIKNGADVNVMDCDGIGVLQTALSAGMNAESVRILLEAGADPDACDVDGDSPRMWVDEEGDSDMVDLFTAFPAR